MLPVIDSSQQHPSTAPTHSSPSLSFSNDHSPSQIAKGEDIFESSLASVTDFTSLNDKHFPNYGDRSALQVSCQVRATRLSGYNTIHRSMCSIRSANVINPPSFVYFYDAAKVRL